MCKLPVTTVKYLFISGSVRDEGGSKGFLSIIASRASEVSNPESCHHDIPMSPHHAGGCDTLPQDPLLSAAIINGIYQPQVEEELLDEGCIGGRVGKWMDEWKGRHIKGWTDEWTNR